MTLAHVIEHGERQWEDICKEEFDKLSAGKWNYDFEILIDGMRSSNAFKNLIGSFKCE